MISDGALAIGIAEIVFRAMEKEEQKPPRNVPSDSVAARRIFLAEPASEDGFRGEDATMPIAPAVRVGVSYRV